MSLTLVIAIVVVFVLYAVAHGVGICILAKREDNRLRREGNLPPWSS
jgi:hypothetical protein